MTELRDGWGQAGTFVAGTLCGEWRTTRGERVSGFLRSSGRLFGPCFSLSELTWTPYLLSKGKANESLNPSMDGLMPGSPVAVLPTNGDVEDQWPSRIVTQQLDTPEGLRLAVHAQPIPPSAIRPDGGFAVDFRLNTRQPLADVAATVRFGSEGYAPIALHGVQAGTPVSPGRPLVATEIAAMAWKPIDGSTAPSFLMLADPGDHGLALWQPDGDAGTLAVQLFRQPLERGVLLVGRFEIRPLREDLDLDLERCLANWREDPKSL